MRGIHFQEIIQLTLMTPKTEMFYIYGVGKDKNKCFCLSLGASVSYGAMFFIWQVHLAVVSGIIWNLA